jgi:hypothetical protein
MTDSIQKPMCIGDLCCEQRGTLPAVRMMPQSSDQGVTVTMVPSCDNHAWGWWDGADWNGRHLETAL